MKNFIKKASIVLIIFLVLILTLITVNTIPKKYIKDNVEESLEVLTIEGHCPPAKWAYRLLLDNYKRDLFTSLSEISDNQYKKSLEELVKLL